MTERTHWIEFFRCAVIATSEERVLSAGVRGVIIGDKVMLALPDGHPNEITTDAVEWLQEQESAS